MYDITHHILTVLVTKYDCFNFS